MQLSNDWQADCLPIRLTKSAGSCLDTLRFCLPDDLTGGGRIWQADGRLCHTEPVPAMSAPSLSDCVALLATDPTQVGHPVMVSLGAVVGAQVAEIALLCGQMALQGKELAELSRQLSLYGDNSGQNLGT